MIDPMLPMELDDGTPVTLVGEYRPGQHHVLIKHHKAPTRPGFVPRHDGWGKPTKSYWSYEVRTGIFAGGDADAQFTIRNVIDTTPEEYEGWFV